MSSAVCNFSDMDWMWEDKITKYVYKTYKNACKMSVNRK